MGMDSVVFTTDCFTNGLSNEALNHFLLALFSIDKDYLRAFPQTPRLYDAGVCYKAEPLGQERWCDIPNVIKRRQGDCEDLACWRAAEIVAGGGVARPIFKLRVFGQFRVYHILVQHGDGLIEDPSYVLGMSPAFNLQSPAQWRE